ncbi:MAG TPA: hypothetical protein VMS12_04155 [Thermoanaerobaculia bacterium]|nr:hypothetical protein [Thermoanaerobaculia bacterium]
MYTQKRPIENAHIVRERDRQRLRELLAVLSLGVPLGMFLLLFTWQNIEVMRLGRQATRLQSSQETLENRNKDLRLEVERLTALGTVESKAISLGLRATASDRLVRIAPEGGAGQR